MVPSSVLVLNTPSYIENVLRLNMHAIFANSNSRTWIVFSAECRSEHEC